MKTFILAGLSFLIISSCTIEEKEPLTAQMRSQLALLPANSTVIGYFNFARIRTSPVYELIDADVNENVFKNEEYEKFVQITGFDPDQNLLELYFASTAPGEDYGSNGMFIALGKYEPDKIIEYIQSQLEEIELESEMFNQHKIFHIMSGDIVFCFKDDQTLIGGKEKLVKNALSDKPEKDEQVLMKNINRLKYKNWAWLVIDTKPLIRQIGDHAISKKLPALENILRADITLNLKSEISIVAELDCIDQEKAKLLKDAMKGFVAAGKLSVSDDRQAVDILNKIKIEVRHNTVVSSTQWTKPELEKLIIRRQQVMSI